MVGHQRVFQQDRWLQAPQVVLEFGHGQSLHLGPCESHVWVLPQEFDQLVDVADVLVRAAVESGAGDNDPAPEPLVFDIDKDVGDGRSERIGSGRVSRLKEEVLPGRQNGHIIVTAIITVGQCLPREQTADDRNEQNTNNNGDGSPRAPW